MLAVYLCAQAAAAPLDPMAYTPIADSLDPSGRVTIDTDELTLTYGSVVLTGVLDHDTAVFVFGDVVLDRPVAAEGSLPVAILSQGDLRVESEIQVYGRGSVPGPGGGAGGTARDGEEGGGPGGGGAEPGAGGGGFGGVGGNSEAGNDGGGAYGDIVNLWLQGGSGGGKHVRGGFDGESGDGGGGGGAIELGAVGRLDVAKGALITADGGDGETSFVASGGGGGSGGAILLHAGGGGRCEGLLTARGGAGGDDAGVTTDEGGGGGGGRIAMLDLEVACETDVSGGDSPNAGDGGNGVVTFRPWEDPDEDGDGYTVGDGDCDDGDPEVHPGADDPPGDGVDGDCDGVDAEDPDPTGPGPGDDPNGTDGPPDGTGGDDPPGVDDPYADERLVVQSACGCRGAPGPAAGPWLLALALALGRARRSRGRDHGASRIR